MRVSFFKKQKLLLATATRISRTSSSFVTNFLHDIRNRIEKTTEWMKTAIVATIATIGNHTTALTSFHVFHARMPSVMLLYVAASTSTTATLASAPASVSRSTKNQHRTNRLSDSSLHQKPP
jgi:hypothetical protein